jgi:hypothetical protein
MSCWCFDDDHMVLDGFGSVVVEHMGLSLSVFFPPRLTDEALVYSVCLLYRAFWPVLVPLDYF